jgi:hypothetical protein
MIRVSRSLHGTSNDLAGEDYADNPTTHHTLPNEMADAVKSKVATGEYARRATAAPKYRSFRMAHILST